MARCRVNRGSGISTRAHYRLLWGIALARGIPSEPLRPGLRDSPVEVATITGDLHTGPQITVWAAKPPLAITLTN
jgi:hypothetical protein